MNKFKIFQKLLLGNLKRIRFPIRLFLVALILRLIPVIFTRHIGIGLDDMFQYDMLARSLAAGNGYRWYGVDDLYLIQQRFEFDFSGVNYDPRGVPTSFRPPLYSAFLALIYFLFGAGPKRFLIARLFQTFLGAALAPMTYSLAKRIILPNERTARLAGWMIALYPMLILFPLALATENLFFFLLLVALITLLRADETNNLWYFVLAGVLFGFTALTRSVILISVGLVFLWVWFVLCKRKQALLLGLAVALTIFPWMARNTILTGRISGIETSLGYQLYQGYHPESEGTFQYGISLDLLTILDDAERDKLGIVAVKEFIRDDPGRIPYLMVRRLGFFFGLERRALTYFYTNNLFGYIPFPILLTVHLILLLPFVVLSLLGVVGFALVKMNKYLQLLILLICGYLLPHVMILAEERFHMAIVPLLAIFAARAIRGRYSEIRERWATTRGRTALVLAGLAALLLLFNWGLELYVDANDLEILFGPNGNESHFPY